MTAPPTFASPAPVVLAPHGGGGGAWPQGRRMTILKATEYHHRRIKLEGRANRVLDGRAPLHVPQAGDQLNGRSAAQLCIAGQPSDPGGGRGSQQLPGKGACSPPQFGKGLSACSQRCARQGWRQLQHRVWEEGGGGLVGSRSGGAHQSRAQRRPRKDPE